MSTVLLRRVMQRMIVKGKIELFSTNPEPKLSKYSPFHIWEVCSLEQMQSVTNIKQKNYRIDQHNQISTKCLFDFSECYSPEHMQSVTNTKQTNYRIDQHNQISTKDLFDFSEYSYLFSYSSEEPTRNQEYT